MEIQRDGSYKVHPNNWDRVNSVVASELLLAPTPLVPPHGRTTEPQKPQSAKMLPQRGAARVLGLSTRPRMATTSSLYTRQGLSPTTFQPTLAPGVSSRRGHVFTSTIESLGDTFISIHASTGLPWYIILPAIGLAHTAIFELPLSLANRQTENRRALMAPLVRAWQIKGQRAKVKNPEAAARAKAEVARIAVETKTQRWRTIVPRLAISIPPWFLTLEATRYLTGYGAANPNVDPTLATEGCLWFLDLGVPDPLHILPVAFGAVWAYRSLPSSWDELVLILSGADTSINGKVRRTVLILTPFLVMSFMNTPADVHLFCIASVASAQLAGHYAKKRYPHQAPSMAKWFELHAPKKSEEKSK
ncbi:hypothetical protein IMZ48_04705 [Candidatus Bathyarchaeota archaeon]|nr:hypothetical protein [Candidatus Bathyarchaeota archaeon]